MTVNEIYRQSIKPLAPPDRLQLARMILNDIPAESLVDYDDSWSDEDLRGDIVTVTFPERQASSVVQPWSYRVTRIISERPDVILAILTTNLTSATASTDCVTQDWSAAGLRAASAFRSYFGMAVPADVRVIGHLSDREAVKDCVHRALA